MSRTFVTRGQIPTVAQLLDMYPWLCQADAERIVAECKSKADGPSKYESQMQVSAHYFREAQRLKPQHRC